MPIRTVFSAAVAPLRAYNPVVYRDAYLRVYPTLWALHST
jgi:hypothetical protein